MRAPKRCNRVQTYRSSPEWYRQQCMAFPEHAGMMPDPSRLPLFPLTKGSVMHAFRCATARKKGGRTDGR
jgi:hypothetical protein